MQSDGYAIARERGNYCRLIADTVEPILSCTSEITVRNMRDGDGLFKQWLRTLKPHREVRTVLLHLLKKALPAEARTRKILPLHHTAKIRDAIFHRLN
jgi:hypothetical protein